LLAQTEIKQKYRRCMKKCEILGNRKKKQKYRKSTKIKHYGRGPSVEFQNLLR